MKIELTLDEGLEIIKEHYKAQGVDVKEISFCLEKKGQVRNLRFEITIKDNKKEV
jgi:hypothetical protein